MNSKLHESLLDQLRCKIELMRKIQQRTGSIQVLPLEEIVLCHGVGRYCLKNVWKGIKRGRPRECFKNAADLAISDQARFLYVEGYAVKPSLGFVLGEHAWVLDRERGYAVVDPTWRNTAGAAYLGVPFSHSYLFAQLAEHRMYGLLDAYWAQWPVRRLPAEAWLYPKVAAIPQDFRAIEGAIDA